MNPVDNFPEFIRWFYQSATSAAVRSMREQFRRYYINLCCLPADQREEGKQYNRMLRIGLYNLELGKQVRLLEDAFNTDNVWLPSYANYIGISLVELHEMTDAEIFDRIRIKLGLPKIPGQP